VQLFVFFLKSTLLGLDFFELTFVLLLDILELFFEFGLHLQHHVVVGRLMPMFRLLLVLLQLLKSRLEHVLRLFSILLKLLLLLLEEFELTLPQGFFLLKLRLKVGMKPVRLVELDFPVLSLFLRASLAILQLLSEIFDFLSQLNAFLLKLIAVVLKIFLKVFVLLLLNSQLLVFVGDSLLLILLQLLVCLSLLLVLPVYVLFFLLESGDPFGEVLLVIVFLLFETLLVPVDSGLLTLIVLVDSTLLELDLLVF